MKISKTDAINLIHSLPGENFQSLKTTFILLEDFHYDTRIINSFLKKSNYLFTLLPQSLQENKSFVLSLISNKHHIYYYLNKTLKADKDIVILSLKKLNLSLEYVPTSVRNDLDVVTKFVLKTPSQIQFASQKLKKNHSLALHVLKHDPNSIIYLDKSFQTNEIKQKYCPNSSIDLSNLKECSENILLFPFFNAEIQEDLKILEILFTKSLSLPIFSHKVELILAFSLRQSFFESDKLFPLLELFLKYNVKNMSTSLIFFSRNIRSCFLKNKKFYLIVRNLQIIKSRKCEMYLSIENLKKILEVYEQIKLQESIQESITPSKKQSKMIKF